jgi:hypothetical protein
MQLHATVGDVRHSNAQAGWFAMAIPATIGYVVAGALVWGDSGRVWLGALVTVALATATAVVSRRRTREGAVAYLGGTAATILGLYAALVVAGEFWLHGLGA